MKFRTFSLKGEDKLQEFLADLGIPLSQVDSLLLYSLSRVLRIRNQLGSGSGIQIRIRKGYIAHRQCYGSGMFIPDPNFFHHGSRIRISSILDPGSASKKLSILIQNMVSKLSKIWFGLFIPDPVPDFLPIPNPESRIQGSKRHRICNTAHRTRVMTSSCIFELELWKPFHRGLWRNKL